MDELYRWFLQVAGAQGADGSTAGYGLAQLIGEIGAAPQNTVTTQKSSQVQSSGGDSTLVTVLKNGLGVAPLIGGLISLFGGGGDDSPPALVKYAMPASVSFDAAETPEGGIAAAGYDQGGVARSYATPGPVAGGSETPAPQITVNVSAMDARSFLDRSSDIAAAVREAMLNLNSINDVVNDL
jgi:hypothetical protein